jgi:hypothetical protein
MAKKLKRDLTQNQKELRQLKTEINQTIKSIRSQVNETTANQQSGFIMKKLLGKGKARSLDADRKRAVKQKGSQIIEPFQKLVSIIDKYILTYDNVKNQMTNIIEEHK